jgi:hypothetical protein
LLVQYIANAATAVNEMSMFPDTITTSTPSAKSPMMTLPFSRLKTFPVEKNLGFTYPSASTSTTSARRTTRSWVRRRFFMCALAADGTKQNLAVNLNIQ